MFPESVETSQSRPASQCPQTSCPSPRAQSCPRLPEYSPCTPASQSASSAHPPEPSAWLSVLQAPASPLSERVPEQARSCIPQSKARHSPSQTMSLASSRLLHGQLATSPLQSPPASSSHRTPPVPVHTRGST